MTAPITINEFRSFSGLPRNTNMTDETLQHILDTSWALIERYCNQKLISENILNDIYIHGTIYCNTQGSNIIIVPRYFPVTDILSVKYSSSANGAFFSLEDRYVYDRKIVIEKSPFESGDYGIIKLSYTHGFVTVPEDLKTACIHVADHILSEGFFPSSGALSESALLPSWLPEDIEKVLIHYRRYR